MSSTRPGTPAAQPAESPTPGGSVRGPTAARTRLVLVLATLSGATDAIGFLGLGSAFTSVMTGNLVLVGMALGTGDTAALGVTVTAIAAFVVGAATGARIAGLPQEGDGVWPSRVTRALTVELLLLLTFAVAWWTLGGEPSETWFAPLLALNAAALGLQSSAVQRFGVPGLSTTYLTGTLTTVVIRLATGHRLRAVGPSLAVLLALVSGAALGALLVTSAPLVAPALQLGCLGTVLLGVRLDRSLRGRR